MEVRFGNLSVNQFMEKTGAKLSAKDKQFLEKHRTDIADFKEDDKYHIFAMPFSIVSGHKIAQELFDMMKKYDDKKVFDEEFNFTGRPSPEVDA